jgi:selenocysteine lyase/cysteine desulfurase
MRRKTNLITFFIIQGQNVIFLLNFCMNKRTFLKACTLLGASAPWFSYAKTQTTTSLASDEDFWEGIRGGYRLKPDYINLENGYYNVLPQATLEKYIQHIRDVNRQGAYYMRTVQFENKKRIAARVARLVGCPEDTLVLTRNTTEALDTIISGFPWKAGDEAIFAIQDYGAMQDMFKQVARRQGIVLKIISLPNNPASDEEIVDLYAKAMTDKTKLIMVCHMVNVTGQINPVRKISDMAHARGVEVMVDGAHAVAHFEYKISDLNCDYYGASLHKWLAAPLGVGILHVRKEKIAQIWPLIAEEGVPLTDIKHLNHVGTIPVHTDLAVDDAIDFYEKLGPARKEARLRYLQNYWTTKVRPLSRVRLHHSLDPTKSCAIANVGIEGMKPAVLAERLLKEYKIYTVAIDGGNVHGCRITPNVFTTLKELDVLVKAISELAS